MKNTLLTILLSLYSASAAESTFWSKAETGIKSKYLGSVGSIFYDSPISITDISFGKDDWYAGIWNSTGLGGTRYGKTYGDEFDLYTGWARTFGPIKADFTASYYAISHLDKTGDDLWVAEGEFSIPKFPFAEPYVRIRYFGEVGERSPMGGMFYYGGIRKNIPFGKSFGERPFVLSLNASTAYAGGALRDSTGFAYGRLSTALDIPLSKRATLSPSIVYQIPTSGQRGDPAGFTDRNQLVYGLTFKYKF